MIVKVILKVGVGRATSLAVEGYRGEMNAIVDRMDVRLEAMLTKAADTLERRAPSEVFRFGKAIGLKADEIVDPAKLLLSGY